MSLFIADISTVHVRTLVALHFRHRWANFRSTAFWSAMALFYVVCFGLSAKMENLSTPPKIITEFVAQNGIGRAYPGGSVSCFGFTPGRRTAGCSSYLPAPGSAAAMESQWKRSNETLPTMALVNVTDPSPPHTALYFTPSAGDWSVTSSSSLVLTTIDPTWGDRGAVFHGIRRAFGNDNSQVFLKFIAISVAVIVFLFAGLGATVTTAKDFWRTRGVAKACLVAIEVIITMIEFSVLNAIIFVVFCFTSTVGSAFQMWITLELLCAVACVVGQAGSWIGLWSTASLFIIPFVPAGLSAVLVALNPITTAACAIASLLMRFRVGPTVPECWLLLLVHIAVCAPIALYVQEWRREDQRVNDHLDNALGSCDEDDTKSKSAPSTSSSVTAAEAPPAADDVPATKPPARAKVDPRYPLLLWLYRLGWSTQPPPVATPPTTDGDSELVGVSTSASAANRRDKIVIEGLTKYFGKQRDTPAVDSVSVSVASGEIYALLGHNGAGKSTMISVLLGDSAPTSYRLCSINGFDLKKERKRIRDTSAFCRQFEDHNVEFLTAREQMELYSTILGVPRTRAHAMLEALDLMHNPCPVSSYSRGMQRLLEIAVALLPQRPVVFLDEPTAGMDPVSRHRMWDVIKAERDAGSAIMLSTHFMEEAEYLGDRIGIMSRGKLVCSDTSAGLKQRYGVGYYLSVVKTAEATPAMLDALVLLCEKHCTEGGVRLVKETHGAATVLLPAASTAVFGDLLQRLEEDGERFGVASYAIAMNSLEDVFIAVAEEQDALHNEAASGGPPLTIPLALAAFVPESSRVPRFRAHVRAVLRNEFADLASNWRGYRTGFLVRFFVIALCFIIVPYVQLINRSDKKAQAPTASGTLPPPTFRASIPVLLYPFAFDQRSDKAPPPEVDRSCADAIMADFVSVMAVRRPADHIAVQLIEGKEHIELQRWLNTHSLLPWDAWQYSALLILNECPRNRTAATTVSYAWSYDQTKHDMATLVELDLAMRVAAYRRAATSTTPAALLRSAPTVTVTPMPVRDVQPQPAPPGGAPSPAPTSTQAPPVDDGAARFTAGWCLVIVLLVISLMTTLSDACAGDFIALLRVHGLDRFAFWVGAYLRDVAIVATPATLGIAVGACLAVPTARSVGTFVAAFIGAFLMVVAACAVEKMAATWFYATAATKDKHSWRTLLVFAAAWIVVPVAIYIALGATDLERTMRFAAWLSPLAALVETLGLHRAGPAGFDGMALLQVFFSSALWIVLSALAVVLHTRAHDRIHTGRTQEDVSEEDVVDHEDAPLRGSQHDDEEEPTPSRASDDVARERRRVARMARAAAETSTTPAPVDPCYVMNLGKAFTDGKNTTVAVKSVTFGVRRGECFGLLGRSGAGKTTTLKMMLHEFPPTAGNVVHSVARERLVAQQKSGSRNLDDLYHAAKLGVCQQADTLFSERTAEEHMEFYLALRLGAAYRPSDAWRQYVKDALVKIGLKEDKHKQRVGEFSGGMRRKLATCIAFYTGAHTVLLDEPTTGVDPHARRIMWEAIHEGLRANGSSALVTTHSMEEADAMCGRIGIIADGALQCVGSSPELKNRFGSGAYCVTLTSRAAPDSATQPEEEAEAYVKERVAFLDAAMTSTFGPSCRSQEQRGLHRRYVVREIGSVASAFKLLSEKREEWGLDSFGVTQLTSLEHIFLEIAGHEPTETTATLGTAPPADNRHPARRFLDDL